VRFDRADDDLNGRAHADKQAIAAERPSGDFRRQKFSL